MRGTYSNENCSPARPSQRTPAIYKFALLVVYSDHKRCVRSPPEYGHLNLDVLVLPEPTPTETGEVEGFGR
jgi:hypothetical protein